jgi:hypothetical protein
MSGDDLETIKKYIDDPHTATTFTNLDKRGAKKQTEGVTSELIYYWMVAYQIPFEAQKWHFNRLMTLIRIASIKNAPDKKMSRHDQYKSQRELNAIRRAKAKSKG